MCSIQNYFSMPRAILSIAFSCFEGGDHVYFQRIRDMREDSDLTQTQVAAILKIQQTVYSRYERGYQTIPLEHLLTLADFYGVSLDFLTGRTNNKRINK